MPATTTMHSFAHLNAEICEFRKLMGMKSFWAKPSVVRQALIALTMLYASTEFDNSEQHQQAERNYQTAIMDWEMRATVLCFVIAA